MGSNVADDPLPADGAYISFLYLPYEIRQQIYRDVLEANPRVERELPGYPARRVSRYVTSPITPRNEIVITGGKSSRYQPIPSTRPLGYIPHNLLRTCKQIYYEARLFPFQTNEFVFTEWLTSAVSYCEAVLRCMQAWQRGSIRHVRFTMGLHELYDRPANERGARPSYQSRLDRICEQLPAVRTMRINLSCGNFPTEWFEKDLDSDQVTLKEDWSGGRRWIDEGLRKMSALRVVEIQCSFLAWMTPSNLPRAEKQRVEEELALSWCAKVEEILNGGRPEGTDAQVVAVTGTRDSCLGMTEVDALTLSFMPSSLSVDFSGSM
ncbi:hypothetical protein BR93DRAFT_979373 [Coniochaeta sp. PMI_546]|nr:hypothetical protein BR93DRAFT_979373 [Coniochaeta sp. PMI_546]